MREIVFEIDGAQFKQPSPTVLRFDGKTVTLVRGHQLIEMLIQVETRLIRLGLHPDMPMIYEPDRVMTIPQMLIKRYGGKVIKAPEALPVRTDVKY